MRSSARTHNKIIVTSSLLDSSMAAKQKRQLTLFTCLPSSSGSGSGKRNKLDEVSSDQSGSDSESEGASLPVANSSTVSTDTVTSPKHVETQENYVTVKETFGSTTIIINNSNASQPDSSVGTASNTASSYHSLGAPDIAQGVHQLPVQPIDKVSHYSDWLQK